MLFIALGASKAASVKVSRDLSSNGARVVLSTSRTH
nr:hypothetical protein [Tanacetum cinerariifolium]